jgi:hypothetical protein
LGRLIWLFSLIKESIELFQGFWLNFLEYVTFRLWSHPEL